MWINVATRKPDTTRHVFVRGFIKTSKFEGETTGIAAWMDFDKRWQTVHLNPQLDTAGFPDIEYWCEIDDLLTLPFEEEPPPDPYDRWYTSAEDRQAATEVGYSVTESAWGFGPTRPDGSLLTRGYAKDKWSAWWYVVTDYKREL